MPGIEEQLIESFFNSVQQVGSPKIYGNLSEQSQVELAGAVIEGWNQLNPDAFIQITTPESLGKVPELSEKLLSLYTSKEIPEEMMVQESERLFSEAFQEELAVMAATTPPTIQQEPEEIIPLEDQQAMAAAEIDTFTAQNRAFLEANPQELQGISIMAEAYPELPLDFLTDLSRRQAEKRQYAEIFG
ncbi:MAG: hypothetical protein ACC656_04695 [Candidatus Heimdallarchaeota archaeon]